MKYWWEVFESGKPHPGLFVPLNPRLAGQEEAGSAQEVAERVRPQMRQRVSAVCRS
jgi:hypothetical protein